MKKILLLHTFLLALGQVASAQCPSVPVPYLVNADDAAPPVLPLCLSSVYATFASQNKFHTVQGPIEGYDGNVLGYDTTVPLNEFITDPNSYVGASLYSRTVQLAQGVSYTLSYRYGNSDPNKTIQGLSASVSAMGTNINIAEHQNITGATPVNFISAPFIVPVTGEYYVSFNAYTPGTQGYLYLDDILVQESEALGVSAGKTENFVVAYPNPAKDIITLSGNMQQGKASILSLTGQKILEQEFAANSTSINICGFAAGMYIVNVEADGRMQSLRIVKE